MDKHNEIEYNIIVRRYYIYFIAVNYKRPIMISEIGWGGGGAGETIIMPITRSRIFLQLLAQNV